MGRPSPRGTHLGDGTQLPLKYAGMLGRGDEGWGVRDGGTWQDGPGTIVEAQRQRVTGGCVGEGRGVSGVWGSLDHLPWRDGEGQAR